jgi:hypothetical protein
MKNHPLIQFIQTAGIFTADDQAKFDQIQANSARIFGHMKGQEVVFLEDEMEKARQQYCLDPSEENLAAAQAACEKLILRKQSADFLLPVMGSAHSAYLQNNFVPWAGDLCNRLREAVRQHFGQVIDQERARSVQLLGTHETANVVQAHMQRIEKGLERLSAEVGLVVQSGDYSPNTFMRRLKSMGLLPGDAEVDENYAPFKAPDNEYTRALRGRGLLDRQPQEDKGGQRLGDPVLDDMERSVRLGEANLLVDKTKADYDEAVNARDALEEKLPPLGAKGRGDIETELVEASTRVEVALHAHEEAVTARGQLMHKPIPPIEGSSIPAETISTK